MCEANLAAKVFRVFPSLDELGSFYGATETLSVSLTYFKRNEQFPDKPLGMPVPHAEIKLVDPNGNIVPIGTNGEICVRSPYILKAYKVVFFIE